MTKIQNCVRVNNEMILFQQHHTTTVKLNKVKITSIGKLKPYYQFIILTVNINKYK